MLPYRHTDVTGPPMGRPLARAYMLPRQVSPGCIMRLILLLVIAVWVATIASLARAAESAPFASEQVTARLLVAENGVAPGSGELSAGFEIVLAPGWKTYWRSPGEVGLPPQLDWSASENVADVELMYPVPQRFEAFGIQNVGYADEVVYPLRVRLERPGEAARLSAEATILVCEKICIPETFALAVDLPAAGLPTGGGVDRDSAQRIGRFAARVPVEKPGLSLRGAGLADGRLVATFDGPVAAIGDAFAERDGASFGKPRIVRHRDPSTITVEVPVEKPGSGPVRLTLANAEGGADWAAATLPVALGASAPRIEPPAPDAGLAGYALLAFLGGLVLNLMPCVLPVLAIKLGSAIHARGASRARIRNGFLLSAAGVMTFVLGLAAVLSVLKASGALVGWGMQFQSPVFLIFVVALLAIFAASMFGLFAIRLPGRLSTAMAGTGSGYAGDFATGAFAALLATPCSAPFLGTAVAFALAGGAGETFAVFAALGLGLALPYLAVAALPRVVRLLPRPGPWMDGLRRILGAALLATALWLIWVLAGVSGWTVALVVAAMLTAAVLLAGLPVGAVGRMRGAGATALMLAAFAVPFTVAPPAARDVSDHVWSAFEPNGIAAEVAAGRTVFVDVTADWCLTCKVNKAAVLDLDAVRRALAGEGVTAMRGDWTRPDDAILRYLKANGRSGIPFNAVYGPGAPGGIVLSELLTERAVMDAIARAGG